MPLPLQLFPMAACAFDLFSIMPVEHEDHALVAVEVGRRGTVDDETDR